MDASRVLSWSVSASGGYETAWTEERDGALRARGRAVGTTPEPYWVSYELDAADGFVTRRLRVTVETAARTRSLDLRHDGRGGWTADGERLPGFEEALDCDLGLCPLTNTMPVLRHGLHRRAGEHRFLMAWVSVPALTVRRSWQTYTHLGAGGGGGAMVRFASGSFRSDVVFDQDGYVLDYPGLATRLG
ncbi:putative glycolipid-binding domain-containing protein [Streptomyces sp. NBC_00199]|uniref:putative glycolipid-binding domain-containing protein n=1 Tax=Streptomyces sp. NBC_00199 TaxID=2975678 RepID=UPI00224EF94C|nr:putative glycolipid-binding domain-containing protein [Streptomyces sp. NBC_00199]MCX5267603.1 putative glycolipid-binding domain-containing protein [Streptomyces sp. NBC_00199]